MAEIRLNKLTKQFNIGLQTLVDFLQEKGADVELNPNSKVSDEYLPALEKKFGDDMRAKQDAEKVDIKMKEIIEKNTRKQQDEEEDDYEPVKETIIKNTSLSGDIVKEEPEEVAQPEVAAKPEPVKAEPEPVAAEAPAEPETEYEEPDMQEPEAPVLEDEPELEPEPEAYTPAEEEEEEPRRHEHKKHHKEERDNDSDNTPGLKVVGKVDLSQFSVPKKGKKRERIKGGSQKVDVTKVEGVDARKKDHGRKGERNEGFNNNNNKGRDAANAANAGGKGRRRDRFKPVMTEAEEEEMQKEIQKQVKETYAKMNEGKKSNFGAKYRKEKREAAANKAMEEMEQELAEKKVLKVTEFVTVNDLATLMNNTPVNKVITACFNLGLMVSINQRLDAEALVLVAEEFGYKVEFVTAELTQEIEQENEADKEEDLVTRPPIITVMGHVDHGKTSLLDYIRKTNVIAGEAGGITQHIGAYNVKLPDGRRITFLDTPGHEAFTAMRARGAQLTDLAIIIIAADDAVMPQTVEAINHAQAAGVPMVFAINKIDKPGAQPEKIYQQLAQMNILTEAWGGKYQCQEISAKKGLNVDKLLEKVLLETDMMDLKANPNKMGVGAVIESSLDKGRGYLATVLVQSGTLHKGDMMISGCFYGRVKSMFNERGQQIPEAGPSTPVSVLGLNGAPSAGEKFNVMSDEREAKAIANKREQLIRIQGIKTQKHMTLEEIGRRIAIGNFKELNVIVKGDVDGSVEALSDSLIKLSTEEIHVNVIHKAVGAISESDVMLATASDAIIIGFQVRPSSDARSTAEKEGIEIRLYSVIYDAINEVKDGIEGMLEPEKKEEVTATAVVKQPFKIPKVGTIAGSLVKEGKLTKSSKVRLIRDGIVVYTGDLASLKRGKEDAKEVIAGMECGIGIENYNDIKEGDVIEAFQIVEIKRTL
ncbi:MAG: translation initiation factor IF-2 [Bacteroidales bacterium]|nr:translation initiation factor IF-2 [Bacteroidales bacterium]